jgi:hypothetical protein
VQEEEGGAIDRLHEKRLDGYAMLIAPMVCGIWDQDCRKGFALSLKEQMVAVAGALTSRLPFWLDAPEALITHVQVIIPSPFPVPASSLSAAEQCSVAPTFTPFCSTRQACRLTHTHTHSACSCPAAASLLLIVLLLSHCRRRCCLTAAVITAATASLPFCWCHTAAAAVAAASLLLLLLLMPHCC